MRTPLRPRHRWCQWAIHRGFDIVVIRFAEPDSIAPSILGRHAFDLCLHFTRQAGELDARAACPLDLSLEVAIKGRRDLPGRATLLIRVDQRGSRRDCRDQPVRRLVRRGPIRRAPPRRCRLRTLPFFILPRLPLHDDRNLALPGIEPGVHVLRFGPRLNGPPCPLILHLHTHPLDQERRDLLIGRLNLPIPVAPIRLYPPALHCRDVRTQVDLRSSLDPLRFECTMVDPSIMAGAPLLCAMTATGEKPYSSQPTNYARTQYSLFLSRPGRSFQNIRIFLRKMLVA